MPTQEALHNKAGIRTAGPGREIQAAPLNEQDSANQLARGLGWFSIGLGLAEILAPNQLSRWIGMGDDHPVMMPMLGFREIGHGIGILSNKRPAGWVWSRVAGDMLDLAVVGSAFGSENAERGRLSVATAALLGVGALDVICAQELSSGRPLSRYQRADGMIHVEKSLAINRPPGECYRFWRDFRNLGQFLKHVQEVRVLDDRRSHWVVNGPAGSSVEWDAEIGEDRTDELITWHSLPGANVDNRGAVRFEQGPGGRGAIIRVSLDYQPPAGKLGALAASLFGEEPQQQLYDDLRRFKQIVETGEVTKSDASIHRLPHSAQPSQIQGGNNS
jgi:uncharacterized membrane protein